MEFQQPPPSSSASLTALQSSIQNLVTNWQRRQRWQLLFTNCCLHSQEEGRKKATWRIHLADFLESMPIHIVSLSLLLLDLIFTIRDLSSSLVSCDSCGKRKGVETRATLVYHWGGVVILSVLVAKAVALAVALGGSFFRRPGQVVDGVVVVGALFLEVWAQGEGGGLLVVVSLWRVVRVVESAFELSDETIEAQIEGITRQFESLHDENQQLQEAVKEKDERIAELEEALGPWQRGPNKHEIRLSI